MKTILLPVLLTVCFTLSAQEPVVIDILRDNNRGSREFYQMVVSEVEELLGERYSVIFNELSFPLDDSEQISKALQSSLSSESDMIITLGFASSSQLASLDTYPKPCIEGITLKQNETNTSGIDNYTFIQSPFSVRKDIEVFKSLYDFEHLAIFVEPGIRTVAEPYMKSFSTDFDIQFIEQTTDVERDLGLINEKVDAVYYLPFGYENDESIQRLIDGINEKKLPSFALIGKSVVRLGALAALSQEDHSTTYARRIALYVMRIIDGENPRDFSTKLQGLQDDFVINMKTMRAIELYPPIDVLSQASFINPGVYFGRELTLQGAVARALEQNIDFQSLKKNVEIQEEEIGIAKSNALPTLSANSTIAGIDENSAMLIEEFSQITPQYHWSGNIQLTQLLYSEPVYANIAAQKMLKEASVAGLESEQLDLILDVSIAYLNYLLAEKNVRIQNENVEISKKNLDIARNRVEIGTRAQADVYGFESQLAMSKGALNDAVNDLEIARIELNTLLNYPLDDPIILEEIDFEQEVAFITDPRMPANIRDRSDVQRFKEYSVSYAFENLPSLDEIDWNILVQERLLKSSKRSLYLPQLSLQANLDKTFGRYGIKTPAESFKGIGYDVYNPTYNFGASASLPIFEGNYRRKQIAQNKLTMDQLNLVKDNTELQVQNAIRSAIENLVNAYTQLEFSKESETASTLFLENIQTLYSEGTTNINTLLDAQNNANLARINLAAARYNVFARAITLERVTGLIYLSATESQREDFITGYLQKEN